MRKAGRGGASGGRSERQARRDRQTATHNTTPMQAQRTKGVPTTSAAITFPGHSPGLAPARIRARRGRHQSAQGRADRKGTIARRIFTACQTDLPSRATAARALWARRWQSSTSVCCAVHALCSIVDDHRRRCSRRQRWDITSGGRHN